MLTHHHAGLARDKSKATVALLEGGLGQRLVFSDSERQVLVLALLLDVQLAIDLDRDAVQSGCVGECECVNVK